MTGFCNEGTGQRFFQLVLLTKAIVDFYIILLKYWS